jgi:hypothetical protein
MGRISSRPEQIELAHVVVRLHCWADYQFKHGPKHCMWFLFVDGLQLQERTKHDERLDQMHGHALPLLALI